MLTESARNPADAIYRATVKAGDYWLYSITEGQTLRITDLEGNQAADTLFFNADDIAERYSMSDTVRGQGGRHDTLGGACATESNTVRYDLEKRHMHACRDSWMLAIAEHPAFGLTRRDITHNINFFMNVPVTQDGGLCFADGISAPGKYVELVAKMNVLVLISNCPQLNNPCNGYNPTPIAVTVW